MSVSSLSEALCYTKDLNEKRAEIIEAVQIGENRAIKAVNLRNLLRRCVENREGLAYESELLDEIRLALKAGI